MNKANLQLQCQTCACILMALVGGRIEAEESGPWFLGKEIFPIDPNVSFLNSGDFNEDGLMDLALANNTRGEITFLYNQDREAIAEARKKQATSRKPNDLPDGARFRRANHPSELQRIHAMRVGDFNDDGFLDLVYAGPPDELVLLYGEEGEDWRLGPTIAIDGGLRVSGDSGLAVGDLNDDGRDDFALLGENDYYIFLQDDSGKIQDPRALPADPSITQLLIADINSDGLSDLMLAFGDAKFARLRFQTANGRLGPEIVTPIPEAGAHWAGDLNQDGETEIVSAIPTTERARVAKLTREDPSGGASRDRGHRQLYSLPLSNLTGGERGVDWTDLNGDGLLDIIVSDPASAAIQFTPQAQALDFSQSSVFPSYEDISQIVTADTTQDGAPEIYLLQGGSRRLGIASLNSKGRIAFPKNVDLPGSPIGICRVQDEDSSRERLIVLSEVSSEDPETGDEGLRLTLSELRGTEVESSQSFPIEESFLESGQLHFDALDLDQDGETDYILAPLGRYETRSLVFRKTSPNDLTLIELELPEIGSESGSIWVTEGDVDGDSMNELILGKNRIARAFTLVDDNGTWGLEVKDQLNAPTSASIQAAVFQDESPTHSPAFYFYDSTRSKVLIFKRDELGVWRPNDSIELPEMNFTSIGLQQLGAPARNCLTFLSSNAIAWMPLEGPSWSIDATFLYESPNDEDPSMNGLMVGDLDQGPGLEIVFIEGRHGGLEIARYDPERGFTLGTRWQVFEAPQYLVGSSGLAEPREGLIADLTQDGTGDIAILVHDRIILYPVAPGSGDTSSR